MESPLTAAALRSQAAQFSPQGGGSPPSPACRPGASSGTWHPWPRGMSPTALGDGPCPLCSPARGQRSGDAMPHLPLSQGKRTGGWGGNPDPTPPTRSPLLWTRYFATARAQTEMPHSHMLPSGDKTAATSPERRALITQHRSDDIPAPCDLEERRAGRQWSSTVRRPVSVFRRCSNRPRKHRDSRGLKPPGHRSAGLASNHGGARRRSGFRRLFPFCRLQGRIASCSFWWQNSVPGAVGLRAPLPF